MGAHHTTAPAPARALLLGALLAAWWGSAAVAGSANSAAAAQAAKDIVADTAQPAAAVSAETPAPRPADTARRAAAPLAGFALDLLREQSQRRGSANHNQVVSPLSIASAMGMVYLGSTGSTRDELTTLMDSRSGGRALYDRYLPDLIAQLAAPAKPNADLAMANRIWVDAGSAGQLPAPYIASLAERYRSDGALLRFADSGPARAQINEWISEHSAGRIPELLPDGSITALTRVVLTNVVLFKSRWSETFDVKATRDRPFQTPGGERMVPTMQGERTLRTGTVDQIQIMELPFAGDYVFLAALPPAGHSLDALEKELDAKDVASWSAALKPTRCRVEIPRLRLNPRAQSLRESLQELGVKAAFVPSTDFTPMLGKHAHSIALGDVFHAAGVVIDETGGEAVASTAVTLVAKSMPRPEPLVCALNRPFVFTITHKPTGVPVFMGKVADPTQN
ncbi:MAG: serpin family protein [Rhodocyclaceae bacterium]|nr:serpin family protein [Rhodocyclaceae bacterium]